MFSLAAFLFIVLFMLVFGAAILSRDPALKANRLFFAWVVLCSTWMSVVYLEDEEVLGHIWRTLLVRTDYAIAVAAAAVLILFVLNFPGRKTTLRQDLLALAPAALMAVLSFTKIVITKVYFDDLNYSLVEEAWGFDLYALVVIGYFGAAFIILAIKYWRAKSPLRDQLRSILIGLLLTLTIAATIGLAFTNELSKETFRFAIYSFVFFVGGTAYAIVRHEFMRVRFILVETLLLGILATLLAQVIVAENFAAALTALISFAVMLVLGFLLVRSVFMEIRHREQLEKLTKELGAANKKLKELDDMKTTFLSIAAHQLRTPLAVAKGYLTSLRQGMFGRLTQKQGGALATLQKSNEELISLINDLLDLSRIESGRLITKIDQVDLVGVVNEIEEFFRPKAAEKKIGLEVEKPAELWVRADLDKSKEVVKNLVDNAIKYTEKGGVAVALRTEGGFGVVSVKDTGYGLSTEDKKHLFEKFVSGSASKKVQVTSGFGLFVVKNLMEAMGGDISAQSPGPGRGTTFVARWPLAKGH